MDTPQRLATLKRIRRLARLMDTAIGIPGTKFRIGIDPIIGLIPGAGDLIATGFSAYIIFLATSFNIPGKELRKMLFNIGLEAVVGTIPLLGDFFDAYFKSNIRNLNILEQYLQETESELLSKSEKEAILEEVNSKHGLQANEAEFQKSKTIDKKTGVTATVTPNKTRSLL
jgi:hypothetical protein